MVTVIKKSDAQAILGSAETEKILEAQKFSALRAALLHIEAARAQVSSVLAVSQPPPMEEPKTAEPKSSASAEPKKEDEK